jgi:short-subunit dehydrogenase involved in D-alanine esterification of teichoic acids
MQTQGHTVLITGGTGGIGRALAARFLAAGNRVIITGRDERRLAALRAEHPALETYVADMADAGAIGRLAAACPEVTVLVNNAAVQHNYDFADTTVPTDLIAAELATNLSGPLTLIKLLLPQLLARPEAAIVNITSGLAYVPKQSAAVYCGSKAGLHIATRALRWQLEGTPVRVFEVIPPLVDTGMTAGRGSGKITAQALVDAFWPAFARDQAVIPIGRSRLLLLLQRAAPGVADRIMRRGL